MPIPPDHREYTDRGVAKEAGERREGDDANRVAQLPITSSTASRTANSNSAVATLDMAAIHPEKCSIRGSLWLRIDLRQMLQ